MVSAQDEYNDETVEVRTNPLPETSPSKKFKKVVGEQRILKTTCHATF